MRKFNNKRVLRFGDGFTLIEVLIAILLIGTAVAALVMSGATVTMANGIGIDISTSEFLIEEFRERSVTVDFADLAALAGTYSPPQDVFGSALGNFSNFSQQVTVTNVAGSDLLTPQVGSDFVNVTVTILKNNIQINSAEWIRTNY